MSAFYWRFGHSRVANLERSREFVAGYQKYPAVAETPRGRACVATLKVGRHVLMR